MVSSMPSQLNLPILMILIFYILYALQIFMMLITRLYWQSLVHYILVKT